MCAAGTLLAGATPALAINEKGDPGGGLTWVQTVLIYVGIPVAAFLLITFLVFLPSIVRGPRYRPGRPWTAGSVWFGGPEEALGPHDEVSDLPATTTEGGGASARW
jgi:hypothetical protein